MLGLGKRAFSLEKGQFLYFLESQDGGRLWGVLATKCQIVQSGWQPTPLSAFLQRWWMGEVFSLVKDNFAPKLPRPFSVLASVFVPYLDAGIIKGNNKSCFLEKSFIQNWLKNQKRKAKCQAVGLGWGGKTTYQFIKLPIAAIS